MSGHNCSVRIIAVHIESSLEQQVDRITLPLCAAGNSSDASYGGTVPLRDLELASASLALGFTCRNSARRVFACFRSHSRLGLSGSLSDADSGVCSGMEPSFPSKGTCPLVPPVVRMWGED